MPVNGLEVARARACSLAPMSGKVATRNSVASFYEDLGESKEMHKKPIVSGQIIATSHDLTRKGSYGREVP